MPPLKEQKKAIILKLMPLYTHAGKNISDEEIDRISADAAKDKTREIALGIRKKRDKQDACFRKYAGKYDIPAEFSKTISLYLDPSDDLAAEEKNVRFIESLKTEEGKKIFAKKIASDLMKVDLSKMMFYGKTEDAVSTYAENFREIELALCTDETLKLTEYLDKSTLDEIRDRKEIFDCAAVCRKHSQIAESEVYTVLPELTQDETMQLLKDLEDEEEKRRLRQKINDEMLFATVVLTLKRVAALNLVANAQYMSYSDMINALWTRKLLFPLRVAVNEEQERIPLIKIPEEIFKGNVVDLVAEPEELVDQICEDCSIVKADAPISINVNTLKITDSRFVLASPKAFAAQGKGFQEECGKLAEKLKKENLWYVSSSGSYGKLLSLLTETSQSSSVPNKEKIDSIIDEALKYCNSFEEKAHGKDLSEKDLKRLEAVMNAKIVLSGHKRTRETITALAKSEHEASLNNSQRRIVTAEKVGDEIVYDVKFVPSFRASAMGSDVIRAADEQKVFNYRNKLENFEKQGGAIGRLASETKEDVAVLQDFIAHKNKISPEAVADALPHFEVTAAKLGLLEMIDQERTLRERRGEDRSKKGVIEAKFDGLAPHDAEWKKVLGSVAKTETVKKFVEKIKTDLVAAAADLTGDGAKTMAADLLKELKSAGIHKELISNKEVEASGNEPQKTDQTAEKAEVPAQPEIKPLGIVR